MAYIPHYYSPLLTVSLVAAINPSVQVLGLNVKQIESTLILNCDMLAIMVKVCLSLSFTLRIFCYFTLCDFKVLI